jgi:hypothetical protein
VIIACNKYLLLARSPALCLWQEAVSQNLLDQHVVHAEFWLNLLLDINRIVFGIVGSCLLAFLL